MLFNFFKKRPSKANAKAKQPEGELVGEITHYFTHCKAGVIKLKKPITAGETIYIKGHTTDFKQKLVSLQIDNKPVEDAAKGKEVGFSAKKRVRSGDKVYRVQ
jgi:hypothetical protein